MTLTYGSTFMVQEAEESFETLSKITFGLDGAVDSQISTELLRTGFRRDARVEF